METESVHELTAAYALDALDVHDEQAYEEHLRTCGSCQAELGSFREAASALAYAAPAPDPPPALRGRILESARAERSNVVPMRRTWIVPVAAGAAALAACAAIALGIWAAMLRSDLSSTRSALDDERAASAILADPSAERSPVTGAEGTLVVARDGRAVLALRGINPAPKGKTYEIWVIQGRTPRPAGLFEREGAVVLTRPVPRGATVGVTIENEGGVEAPTMAPRITARA